METAAAPTAHRFVTVGTTEEWDACDCCGRTNLTVYVVMRDEDGEFHRFGTGCAAKMEGVPAAAIRKEAKDADAAARAIAEAARRARSKAEAAEWFAWLDENAGPGETPDQITRLGGFAAARAMFRAA
jgi:hypothetical protein